jgi:hypothetical protein
MAIIITDVAKIHLKPPPASQEQEQKKPQQETENQQ